MVPPQKKKNEFSKISRTSWNQKMVTRNKIRNPKNSYTEQNSEPKNSYTEQNSKPKNGYWNEIRNQKIVTGTEFGTKNSYPEQNLEPKNG